MIKDIKSGTRVKVLRLDGKDADFYATLNILKEDTYAELLNCSNSDYEWERIYLPKHKDFGKNEQDYFQVVKEETSNDNKNIPGENSELNTLIPALSANDIVITDIVYELYHTNTLVIKINQEVMININKDSDNYKVIVYYESICEEFYYDNWLSAMESIVEHLRAPKEGVKLSRPNDIDTYQIVKDHIRDLYNIINLDTSSIIFTKHVGLSKIKELIETKEYELIKDNKGGN